MFITHTMLGSLIAGVACWLLFWYGASHVDSIPYLNQYLSRKMLIDWIRKNPQLAVIITELKRQRLPSSCCIESAQTHRARVQLLTRASDTTLRLIVTDRPDLDNFRFADHPPANEASRSRRS